MRLTIRVILQMMTATGYALDEMRNTKYASRIDPLRVRQTHIRQELSAILDEMIDKGEN